jgi:hypothetical protein
MAQILVRNLDAAVVEQLKKRARSKGRSLQAEAKAILEQEAERLDPQEILQRLEEFRRSFKGKRFSDSVRLIREDRER